MTEEQRERRRAENRQERKDRWRYEIARALKVPPGNLTEDGEIPASDLPPRPVFSLGGARYTVVADGSPVGVPEHWERVGYSWGWILFKEPA